MKVLVILLVLAVFASFIPTALAQQVPDCTFGGTMTPLSEKFAKDLAVKEFLKNNPNATKNIPTDDSGKPKNQLVLYTEHNSVKETLELHFNIDDKGCYIPAEYHYKYNDGVIDVIVINTIGNFTEIMTLIKSDTITIDNFYPNDCDNVNLEYSISSGKVYGICEKENSIFALIDAYSDTVFEVNIPIEMVYSLPSKDCIPSGDFFVMGNRGSPTYDITESDIGNRVSVDLTEGFHRIGIAGTIILPSPSPAQYCGVVEGFDKPYLPPRNQIDNGMKPTSVRCNEGLILVQKYNGTPACVTESTKQKLVERGWTKIKSNTTDETTTNPPFHKNQDATELPSYRDIRSSIQIDQNAPILSNNELDRTLDELRHSGLPIVMSAIDYEKGVIAIWTPDVSNEEPFREYLGDIPFVLLFEEAPPRWEHGDPKPLP